MRHDYPEGRVNGAFAGIVLAGFIAAVVGALTVIAVVVTR